MMHGWKKNADHVYVNVMGSFALFVVQKDEIWVSSVHYDGELVDRGEWDSRSAAFRNAEAAYKRACKLRNPLTLVQDEDDDEDD